MYQKALLDTDKNNHLLTSVKQIQSPEQLATVWEQWMKNHLLDSGGPKGPKPSGQIMLILPNSLEFKE